MVLTRSMTRTNLDSIYTPIENRSENKNNDFIGYKLVFVEPESIISGPKTDKVFGIAKLLIPSVCKTNLERDVVNKKYAKYRSEYAKVIYIKSIVGRTMYRRAYSVLKPGGYYVSGKYICCNKWNDNIDEVCTNGIHFYLSKQCVYSLYLSMTNTHINKTTIKNIINPLGTYICADDDGKIEYKAQFDKKGNLYKIKSY